MFNQRKVPRIKDLRKRTCVLCKQEFYSSEPLSVNVCGPCSFLVATGVPPQEIIKNNQR